MNLEGVQNHLLLTVTLLECTVNTCNKWMRRFMIAVYIIKVSLIVNDLLFNEVHYLPCKHDDYRKSCLDLAIEVELLRFE